MKYFFFTLALVCFINGAEAGDVSFIYENTQRLDFVKSSIAASDPYYLEAYNSLVSKANTALTAAANPVVDKTQTPPSGDMHDYLSLAPYWWPDPSTSDGLPWIKKDGEVNPETRGNHTDQQRLATLFSNVESLSLAYYFSGKESYAQKAKSLIQIWFIDAATKMNPNINYGQGVPGRNTGREYGVIEFTGINAMVTSMQILEQGGLLDADYITTVKTWLTDYVTWLTTSTLGVKEGNTKNNHAVWYDYQVIGIQKYVGLETAAISRLNAFKTSRIEDQIATDGKLPAELSRTKSVNYTTMNLRAFILVAEMGNASGVDLLNYSNADGRGIRTALAFLKPYVEGSKTWTWQQITGGGAVQAIEDLMKPTLLGLATSVYNEDFVDVSENVHSNMSYLYRIKYPYNSGGNSSIDTTRILTFENLVHEQEIALGTNLTVAAKVGPAFKEVSLWSGDVNLGTLSSAPYQWSSHAILTDMTAPSYTFKLVAIDSANVTVEKSIIIYTPEIFELATKTSLHISFEDEAIANWKTDGADYGVVPAIIDGINTRAGSKVMALEFPANSSGHHVQNIADKIAVADSAYVHLIAYTATSDVAIGRTMPTIKLGDWAPTPSFTTHAAVDAFERKITSRQHIKGDSLNCYPRLRSKAQGGACVVYYDDMVLYTDNNETADLTSPESATDLIVNEQATDGVELSWTEGLDAKTGVKATLVLRTSTADAVAPEMMPQASYSTADDNTSVSVMGDWTVIALLPNGTTAYADKTTSADVMYTYAIVHKDLAYNYSIPLISGEDMTVILEMSTSAFKCVGLKGAIELSDFIPKRAISIFSISGAKVFQQSTNSSIYVSLEQGLYLVECDEEVMKVMVK